MFTSKRFVYTATVLALTTLLLLYYMPHVTLHSLYATPPHLKVHLAHQHNGTKYILYYTKMFDNATFYLGQGSKIFKHCPISNCYATTDKTLMALDKFDALMFHANGFNPFGPVAPKIRRRKQYYIWVNLEAPSNSHMYRSTNYFNWSMTYRKDSDLYRPYGQVKTKSRQYTPPTIEDIKRRPSKIAWAVSNCNTYGRRDLLYKAINERMPVDVFGKCGTKSCPRTIADDCFVSFAKQYKFYLSFENTICPEYVTEKFFKILQYDIIPIVYGGANYTKIAPPQSFIDVSKFESVEDLVKYLDKLDKNPQMYLEYFKWKKDFVIVESNDDVLCEMCKKLHKPIQSQYYEDITDWYVDNNSCRYEKQLPKIVADLIH